MILVHLFQFTVDSINKIQCSFNYSNLQLFCRFSLSCFLFSAEDIPPDKISRGSVISHATKDPCKPVRSFVGQIILLGGPGEFTQGYRPVVCAHGLYISCMVSKLISRFDKANREILEHEPEKAVPGDGVMCEVTFTSCE